MAPLYRGATTETRYVMSPAWTNNEQSNTSLQFITRNSQEQEIHDMNNLRWVGVMATLLRRIQWLQVQRGNRSTYRSIRANRWPRVNTRAGIPACYWRWGPKVSTRSALPCFRGLPPWMSVPILHLVLQESSPLLCQEGERDTKIVILSSPNRRLLVKL